jgi:phosphoglycerate dehydrogenase-like enzyme
LPADHALWDAPGAIITPHVGGGADDWHARAVPIVVAQLCRFLAGEPLTHVARAGTPG